MSNSNTKEGTIKIIGGIVLLAAVFLVAAYFNTQIPTSADIPSPAALSASVINSQVAYASSSPIEIRFNAVEFKGDRIENYAVNVQRLKEDPSPFIELSIRPWPKLIGKQIQEFDSAFSVLKEGDIKILTEGNEVTVVLPEYIGSYFPAGEKIWVELRSELDGRMSPASYMSGIFNKNVPIKDKPAVEQPKAGDSAEDTGVDSAADDGTADSADVAGGTADGEVLLDDSLPAPTNGGVMDINGDTGQESDGIKETTVAQDENIQKDTILNTVVDAMRNVFDSIYEASTNFFTRIFQGIFGGARKSGVGGSVGEGYLGR